MPTHTAQLKRSTDNVVFEDQQPSMGDSRQEIISGLKQSQKMINPKYFYDARGSQLFEQITTLPEYYPTRSECFILDHYAEQIAERCGTGCVLIEPGSGSSEKVRLLLEALKPSAYVPLDISAEFLYEAAVKLGREFNWLTVHAVCADFSDNWQVPRSLPEGKRVAFYPGSTIGNLEPERARDFLSNLRGWLGQDGGVLIGVDLHKSEQRLNAAYNDQQGVTAAFNLNVLNQLNELLDADFSESQFDHHAFYNQQQRRIEMHLVSRDEQTISSAGDTFTFTKGETIHTENSYKYTLESFQALTHSAGFTIEQSWMDDEQLFSVHYLSLRT